MVNFKTTIEDFLSTTTTTTTTTTTVKEGELIINRLLIVTKFRLIIVASKVHSPASSKPNHALSFFEMGAAGTELCASLAMT